MDRSKHGSEWVVPSRTLVITKNRNRLIDRSGVPHRYKVYTQKDLDDIPYLRRFSERRRLEMKAVAAVLPFRVNNYVIDELVDWSEAPADPIFRLTFPQPEMLDPADLRRMTALLGGGATTDDVQVEARRIRKSLNPHPAGQMDLNVPRLAGMPLSGMQHKYRETVLFFPAAGQTCHAYCTYCFRWAQFVGSDELKFAGSEAHLLSRYLKAHLEVSSVLFTGGDPMVMRTRVLRRYVDPLLDPRLDHVQSIRFGTKAPAYWPYRFTNGDDADALMRLFERVVRAGRHLAIMVHYSHPRELDTPVAREALRRIRRTGAVIRTQAPLIRHVNDSTECWADMWRLQVRLGAVPYYMFVERDTGARNYFEVPLLRALNIFNDAYRSVSGLARSVRGPSMSASPGKVLIDGVATIGGEDVFVLKFLQARDPRWVGRPFFARIDPKARWLDDLRPAFGEREFFFEPGFRAMCDRAGSVDDRPLTLTGRNSHADDRAAALEQQHVLPGVSEPPQPLSAADLAKAAGVV
jgi:L-lysine 2,3-aminomutase